MPTVYFFAMVCCLSAMAAVSSEKEVQPLSGSDAHRWLSVSSLKDKWRNMKDNKSKGLRDRLKTYADKIKANLKLGYLHSWTHLNGLLTADNDTHKIYVNTTQLDFTIDDVTRITKKVLRPFYKGVLSSVDKSLENYKNEVKKQLGLNSIKDVKPMFDILKVDNGTHIISVDTEGSGPDFKVKKVLDIA